MALRRKPNTRKVGPQPSVRHGQGKRPRGIEKDQVQKLVRKSARLEQLQDRAASKDRSTDQRQPSPSSASNLPIKPPQKAQTFPQDRNQKRKRPQEAKDRLQNPVNLFQKRPRTSLLSSTVKNIPCQEATSNVGGIEISPIRYWIQTGHWPRKYSKQGSSMNSLLARKKSTSSLRRKGSESSAATPSDEKPREEKSAPYKHRRYEILLGTKGAGDIRHMLLMGWAGESIDNVKDKKVLSREISRSKKEIRMLEVVHKDLRPANMLWNDELRRVLIIDFHRSDIDGCPMKTQFRPLKTSLHQVGRSKRLCINSGWTGHISMTESDVQSSA
ncbi:hypothetical protein AJ78_07216 [Emergomyces pasteurianus Ep9510]|uniref:Protein kinase domain-containing protein n=1 Tax=Emergomyces pasteurianus Ep9510 TaxID=1447872 RepID=A0A1J9P625_9EURO|nr:hypothetical protein AJ78_07216 [Emergomyces pasteurianus Ep9510]